MLNFFHHRNLLPPISQYFYCAFPPSPYQPNLHGSSSLFLLRCCLGGKELLLPLKKLKGHHFFQYQASNLLRFFPLLNIAHVPTTYVDFFIFMLCLHTYTRACVFASPSKPAVRILSFHLLESVPKHTYSQAVEILSLQVTDTYSYCIWGWSILLKFQPMFFSLAFSLFL